MHQQEMLKRNTDTPLLALLEDEVMYGYQIVKEVDRMIVASLAFLLGPAMLDPALELRQLELGTTGEAAEASSLDEGYSSV